MCPEVPKAIASMDIADKEDLLKARFNFLCDNNQRTLLVLQSTSAFVVLILHILFVYGMTAQQGLCPTYRVMDSVNSHTGSEDALRELRVNEGEPAFL